MRGFTKRVVDTTLVPLARYIALNVWLRKQDWDKSLRPTLFYEVMKRAVTDSADYADAEMAEAMCFNDVEQIQAYAIGKRSIPGLVVEFGVFQGKSITFFAGQTKETIFGFDSFEGLKEDWTGNELQKGVFDLQGVLPKVPANAQLIKGWFNETLPGFLREHTEEFSFVHIDCDTYEGAKAVFDAAGDRIVKGTIVLFDEYFGYRGWRLGEFKAWQEFKTRRGLTYRYLAFSNQQVLVVVT